MAARGRSDTERLQTGELVYAGVRRTPICALATELPLRGIATGLAAEIFASTLDVYLTLGDIESNPSDLSTADGRPATVEAARDRLARMVGADRDGFSAEDALAFAHAADECLIRPPVMAAERAAGPTIGRPAAAVVVGLGRVPGAAAGRRAIIEPGGPIISLQDAWGPVASSAGCAYALVKLALERFGAGDDRTNDPRPELSLEGDSEMTPVVLVRHQGRRQPLRLARVSPPNDRLLEHSQRNRSRRSNRLDRRRRPRGGSRPRSRPRACAR